jgi:aldose 1-epimerase
MKISLFFAATFMLACQSCIITTDRMEQNPLDPQRAEAFASGDSIRLYTLSNTKGMIVELSNYGATIVAIHVPNKDGEIENVTLGYDDHAGLASGKSYFGCVVGRYANRIAHARFAIDGKNYQVPQNDGQNSLHGGVNSIDKQVWTARVMNDAIRFTRTMENGENGYPGKMQVTVVYSLRDDNSLVIDYTATTDQTTVLNITNHAYFNLTGNPNNTILDHQLMINAGSITPVDSTLIPTGELKPVAGTPFDFKSPAAIGSRIGADDEQLKFGKGYDHNFVLDKTNPAAPAAVVTDPVSGRKMEVFTTEPGVQFYTGNFLNGSEKGRGTAFQYRTGFCLETQHFPDSPNQPAFPSTLLKPGETFKSQTTYRFSVLK